MAAKDGEGLPLPDPNMEDKKVEHINLRGKKKE